MCLGCTLSFNTMPLHLLKTDEKYRVAVFLKLHGWNAPTENKFRGHSGGSISIDSAGHKQKFEVTDDLELNIPTVDEIKEQLKDYLNAPRGEDDLYKQFITNPYSKDETELEKWAQLWVAVKVKKNWDSMTDKLYNNDKN